MTEPALDRIMNVVRAVPLRGKSRMLNACLPASGLRRGSVFGSTMELDVGDFVQRHIYAGAYELLNVHRFRRVVRPGHCVVDVGANIGFFTLLAARLVGPTGRVIAIEPHPTYARELRRTLDENRLDQVTLVEEGLDRTSGRGRIGTPAHSPRRSATMMEGSGEYHEVATSTLDELLVRLRVRRIGLLKMGVDGYETRVLQGARTVLEQKLVENAIVEFAPYWMSRSGSSEREMLALLADGGLREIHDRVCAALLGPCTDRMFAGA